jgi:RimJ/RimL family protein N-acetyltransferase
MANPGVEGGTDLQVRALGLQDVAEYIDHMVAVDADSGVDGGPHFHPYGASDAVDVAERRQRERARWSTALDETGWRRAWGLFDGSELVGHLYLAGGMLRSELHRVSMGMAIAATHRRRGGGGSLLATAIAWAHDQPGIDWIDLGVFSDNPGARALYERHRFVVVGRVPDRFRVDGVSLDDTQMTLHVGDDDVVDVATAVT